MKPMIHLMLFSICYLSLFSCTSKKDTTATSQNTTTTASTPPAPAATQVASPKDEATVRFVVSFYSVGEGIDGNTNDEFVNFLNSYTKKIAYTPTYWGREGEVDYCLSLNELSSTEQTDFIKKAKEILSKSKLVHTKENSKCDNVGWPLPGNTAATGDIYKLVVSFYSIGEGSDAENIEKFEKFLNSYSKKIVFEPIAWGREGEVDYCLILNELSSAEQLDFIKKTKELLSKSKLVHVNENAKCVHKQ